MNNTPWRSVVTDPPPNGIVVETKIVDENGEGEVWELVFNGCIWFIPGWLVQSPYTPTHWRVSTEVYRER